MKNVWYRKCLIYIIVLTLTATFSAVMPINESKDEIGLYHEPGVMITQKNTMSNGPVYNLNTGENFSTIREAIDDPDTLAGHTIFVENGTYYENVLIDKSISLIGESKNNTIIDGRNLTNTIRVTADHVIIRGFTVTNSSGVYPESGILLDYVENSTITDNILSGNNGRGIFTIWGSNNNISDNHVIQNVLSGIRVDGTTAQAYVSYNTIENNGEDGLFLYWAYDTLIENNTVSNNLLNGITTQGGSKNNIIRNNNIAGNEMHGIYVVVDSTDNNISENKITENQELGVYIRDSNNTSMYRNTFTNDGLYIRNSFGNVADENTVNGKPLVYLEDISGYTVDDAGQVILIKCSDIQIEKLNISTADIGMELWQTSNSIIVNNTLAENMAGILLADSPDNKIYHNNFVDNTRWQAYLPSYAPILINLWDNGYPSGGNYWSDYTGFDSYRGPNQDSPGSDGIGDTSYNITGSVNPDRYPLMNPWNGTSPVPPLDFVYVDDDFNSSTPGWQYDHFDTIPNGIGTVAKNGTVYVYNGTYIGPVSIGKPLTLMGEDKYGTVLDGNCWDPFFGISTITIRTNWVTVDNLGITGGGGGGYDGGDPHLHYRGGVEIAASHAIISNCYVFGNHQTSIGRDYNSDLEDILIESNIVEGTPEGIYFFFCYNSENIRIVNNTVYNCGIVIDIWGSGCNISITGNNLTGGSPFIGGGRYSMISKNHIKQCSSGFGLHGADITFENNTLYNNTVGIVSYDGFSRVIRNNIIHRNDVGLKLDNADDNLIYHNDFVDNTNQVLIIDAANITWDNGYPSGGNYWNDYNGVDMYSGPGQNITGGDGIGDTPYNISGTHEDRYPLMQPWLFRNQPPIIGNPSPINGSTGVSRPPAELNITVEDRDGDPMDVCIKWKNHDDKWKSLICYNGTGDGTYNYIPPNVNDWIWGDTTYVWSVNVTDGTTWTNETYHYTTGGSRYDVNNDGTVNFQDAGLVWVHRTSISPYDGIYDVNGDGAVTFQDAGLTWTNRN